MRVKKDSLYTIPGNVPKPGSIQVGCRFAARCAFAQERCVQENPPMYRAAATHQARCFLLEEKIGGEVRGELVIES